MASDLTLNPDYVFEEEILHNTLISEFENGYEQRRNKWSSPLRAFRFDYINRSASDLSTLQTLFTNKKGRYSSFTFTNPNDSTEYTLRFDQDNLSIKRKAYGVFDISFRAIQVRA